MIMNDTSGENGKVRRKAFQLVKKNQEHILHVIRDMELQQYRGKGVNCTVCNQEFSSFAPVYKWILESHGISPSGLECKVESPTGRCPNCGSLPRHRLLWHYLHDHTKLFDGIHWKLLEIAPIKPFFTFFSGLPFILYYPCDLNPEQSHYQGYPGKILKADLCNLPFDDDSFDVILCSHVLEHVVNDHMAMAEMYRVMARGGWGIFQSPVFYNLETTLEDPAVTTPEEREKLFGQRDHVRKYGQDYGQRISGAGFHVSEIGYVNTFTPEEIAYFGFDPFEKIFLCEKG